MGRWLPGKLYPVTEIDAEEKARADRFIAGLTAFLQANVDADMHPHLAGHFSAVGKQARRMARALFHQMVKLGPKLEKRQVLLGRSADIGADLFALAACCVHAQKLLNDGEPAAKVLALVGDFQAQAMTRVGQNFRGLGRIADQHGYDLAQQVIAGDHEWLERGIL